MGSIRASIELHDNFTNILLNVINAVNMSVSTMEQMQSVMNEPIDTTAIQGIRDQLNQATLAARELDSAMQNVDAPDVGVNSAPVILPVEPSLSPDPLVDQPAPVEVPIEWQSNNLDVFTNSGVERFEMEVQSANNMLNTLNQTQAQIAARAAQTSIFPPNMVTDMNGMQNRLQAIQERIQTIENNPMNMGTDTANAELEQLRAQLNQAVQEQEVMNRAVENMDVQAANEAYLRLSQIIGGTERHIRDNVDEQGRFRREIEESTDSASDLKNMITGAVGAFAGMAGLKKAKDWIDDCTAAFNTQLNAETQLISVLSNMLDEEYVAQFEVNVAADTTAAVDEINNIQTGVDEIVIPVTNETEEYVAQLKVDVDTDTTAVDEIVVPVTAETRALTAAYDQITAKASEIQGRGIYGDEAMIAAAAEFSTYFTDTDAITMMMDTLANYTMGMSGGGAIDATGMVNYATNLGKIMSGAYDAMTKKGFEFTEAQKAIIQGEATREQIAQTLGEEYLDMSSDMQAAAAISQVIDEGWAGLYESMSNTPEGKIIQMSNTWGDMKEVVGGQLYPYVLLFVDAITQNWGTIQTVLDGITFGLQMMLGIMSWLLEGAMGLAQGIIDNWGWISPIIYGIIGALAIYGTYLAVTKGIEMASAAIKGAMIIAEYAHAAATGTAVTATTAEAAAQMGLNTALLACPLTWIIIAIIALIVVIYAVVAAVNHFAGTSVSATGIIAGVFAVLGAFIINTFVVPVQNVLASLANFIGNFANDPVAAVKVLFYDMCLTVVGYIQNLAKGIEDLVNRIPGVSIDITSGLDDFYSQLEQAQQEVKDEAGWVEYVKKMDYVDYSDAWDAGYSFGEGIDEKLAEFDPSSLFGATDIPSADDYAGALTAGGIGSGVDDIAGNTGAMADAMDITGEELKYLRDIAEQEAINRFTTAEISIEQTNHNTIKNGMDLDGIMSGMTDMVNEAIDISTEGVHD